MAGRIKVWAATDTLLFSELNAEFDNLLTIATTITSSSIAAGSITELKLANSASPAVYFGEIFKDDFVIGFPDAGNSGLTATVGLGTAYIFDNTGSVDKMLRVVKPSAVTHTLAANTGNFVDLGSDGVFDVNANANVAAGHTRLWKFTTDGSSVTATEDLRDIIFPEIAAVFPNLHSGLVADVPTVSTATIETGTTVRNSLDTQTLKVISDITVDITTVGLNGRDQGSETSSTWYALLLIADLAGTLPLGGLLVAETNYPASIVFPTGYDTFRRVRWVRNDSSSDLILGPQIGDTVTYDDEHNLTTSISATWEGTADVSTSTFASPSTRMIQANVELTVTAASATPSAGSGEIFISRSGLTGSTGGKRVAQVGSDNSAVSGDTGRQSNTISNIPVDSTSTRKFGARSPTGTGVTVRSIGIVGYIDKMND